MKTLLLLLTTAGVCFAQTNVPSTRKVNGHALNADVTVVQGDIPGLTTALDSKVTTADHYRLTTLGLSKTAIGSYVQRDLFTGASTTYARNGTVTSEISGTTTTYEPGASSLSTYKRANGVFRMDSTNGWCGLKTSTTVTHTAGFTGVAYVKLTSSTVNQIRIGFCSSSFLSGGYDNVYRGVVLGNVGGGNLHRVIPVEPTTPSAASPLMPALKEGDIIGIAIKLTASGYQAWMQGGSLANWGMAAPSGEWMMIYEYTGGTTAGNLSFAVENRYENATILDFGTTNEFYPDSRTGMMLTTDNTRPLVHVGNAAYDPAGNLWTSWCGSSGVDGDAAADNTTYVRVRLPDGRWSAATVASGPGSGGTRTDPGTIWIDTSGAAQLVMNTTTDTYLHTTTKRHPLSVNSSAVVTVGAAVTMTMTNNTTNTPLTYQKPVTLTTGANAGRIIIPFNDAGMGYGGVANGKWWALYSDNGGSTWTQGTHYFGPSGNDGFEPIMVEEGVSKTLVAYIRTSQGTSATMPRYVSADGGETWTQSGTIPIPSCMSRAQGVRMPNGVVAVIGNDSTANYTRKNTTIWLIGEGGTLVGKLPVLLDAASMQNYPALAVRDERLAIVIPYCSNGNGSPGQVFFAEQPLDDWAKAGADSNYTLKAAAAEFANTAKSGVNTDVLEANAVTKMSGFLHTTPNAAIYTVGNGNGYGYGFDANGVKLFGWGISWHIGTDGRWYSSNRGINAGGPSTFTSGTFSTLIVATGTPASASAAGTTGTILWDSSYLYVCTATNTWKRVAIATW